MLAQQSIEKLQQSIAKLSNEVVAVRRELQDTRAELAELAELGHEQLGQEHVTSHRTTYTTDAAVQSDGWESWEAVDWATDEQF
jgi:uncharacterized protein YlxW (UPF0749 family)